MENLNQGATVFKIAWVRRAMKCACSNHERAPLIKPMTTVRGRVVAPSPAVAGPNRTGFRKDDFRQRHNAIDLHFAGIDYYFKNR